MREKIIIQPMKRGDIFTISFSGPSPVNVVKVTNGLAAKFIEENLKYRQERATETSSYTGDELQMAKQGMDQKENAMRDYKLKYYYEMPEQKQTNVVRLISLQEQYQGKQESIQDLERTLILIQDQLAGRKKIIESSSSATLPFNLDDGKDVDVPVGNIEQLAKMELFLEQLLLRYTEKHPEVKRTKKLIAKLKIEIALDPDAGNSVSGSTPGAGTGGAQQKNIDANILQLEAQRKNIKLNVDNIRQEQVVLKEKIGQYEKWVASAPTREAEWSSLTREYGQLKRHYDYLVSQNLQAKSMLNLERRQKGSQFKIEDPARYPGKPIKPDFFKILGAAVAIGLGLGFGLTFFLDFFDTSFRDGDSVVAYLGLPLISTIPYIDTKKEVKTRKWYAFLSFGFLSCFFLLILALFFYVWRKGLIVI
jgi:polysaccharide chain length determinant protein (PEP-CTERM system associated)